MGLVVQLASVTSTDADPDTVIDVAPLSARLEAGESVLVTYAVAPKAPSTSAQRAPRSPADAVVQHSDTPVGPPSPSSTPTVTATPTPTPTPTDSATTSSSSSATSASDSAS